MKHVIQHNLTLPRSKQVVEHAFNDYQRRYARYNPSLVWLDDRQAELGFTAKGMSLKAHAVLSDGSIEVSMDVPFLLRVFKQPAMKIIDREVKRVLSESSPSEQPAL